MRELEHRFPRELAIVGVHSGKYPAERVTERIRDAAVRLGNAHPIVNDRQFRVWRSYAVRAWPTLVVIDPAGYVLGTHAGEFTSPMLEPLIERVIGAFDPPGELDRRPVDVHAETPVVASGALHYPGKVALAGERIAVADSGHHRVLVGRLAGGGDRMQVERVVGTGVRGYRDGLDARFDFPQGLAFDGDTLYVADAGSHTVRAVALESGEVRTIAGTGAQLRTRADLDAGALASPWDLVLVGRSLYIAMAGVHRLWTIDLESGAVRPFSGSGREDIADGPHAEAALAQPMGIVADADALYVVDAESSAVRRAALDPAGGVTTIVGTGLFDFGDEDGTGDEVRMQHQQGLALHPDGRLLVADSYNDALKWVDPRTRRAESWVRGLHEPGGLAIGDGRVYVADTNAHRIAILDEPGGALSELTIEL